jgi:hypothetical protein
MNTVNKGQRNSSKNKNSHNGGDEHQDATRRARDATFDIQNDTQASLARTLAAATETTELGATTLDELCKQRKTLERTQEAGDRLNAQLDKTEKLQNTLSRLGGWNHWGKRGEAKKMVQQDLKMEQAKKDDERKQTQRQQEHTTPSPSPPSHSVVVEKKKSLLGRKKEKPTIVSVSAAEKKALGGSTFGLGKSSNKSDSNNNSNDKEQDEFLRRVEATDHDIDAGMNAVDAQLDQLLNLATSMKDEVRVQSSVLDHVDDQLQTANQKQKVAAHRMGRFF